MCVKMSSYRGRCIVAVNEGTTLWPTVGVGICRPAPWIFASEGDIVANESIHAPNFANIIPGCPIAGDVCFSECERKISTISRSQTVQVSRQIKLKKFYHLYVNYVQKFQLIFTLFQVCVRFWNNGIATRKLKFKLWCAVCQKSECLQAFASNGAPTRTWLPS